MVTIETLFQLTFLEVKNLECKKFLEDIYFFKLLNILYQKTFLKAILVILKRKGIINIVRHIYDIKSTH